MRKTSFSLIVKRNGESFAYQYGFKSKSDAEEFTKQFGGVAEHIDCIFYDNLQDAVQHQSKIQDAKTLLNQISNDEIIKHLLLNDPDIINKIKEMQI